MSIKISNESEPSNNNGIDNLVILLFVVILGIIIWLA